MIIFISSSFYWPTTRCTVGLDIDGEALVVAQQNAIELELADHTEWVQCDVATLLTGRFKHKVDTVIMNPPFGTKNKGIDLVFLEKALHVRSAAQLCWF